MPGVIYTSPIDAYKKTHFHVMVSNATPYQPNMPKYFIQFNVRPFHEQDAGWNFVATFPERIVEMLTRGIEFFFDKPNDKKYAAIIIEQYVSHIEDYAIRNKEKPNEIKDCRTAINMLKDSYNARTVYYAQKYPERFGLRDLATMFSGKIMPKDRL